MNQHTAGPWATSRDAVPAWHTQITVYQEETGKRVATAFESDDNAQLIAAAPELLEALCQAFAVMDSFVNGQGAVTQAEIEDAHQTAHEAIRKATQS